MNPVENTIPEEELQKRTRFNNFTIMQYPFSNTKVAMLASHSTGCSAAGKGEGLSEQDQHQLLISNHNAPRAAWTDMQSQCLRNCMHHEHYFKVRTI